MQQPLLISYKRIPPLLSLISLVLCVLGLSFTAYEWSLDVHNTYWAKQLSEFFNVSYEANLPSWYSAFLLLCAAVLSAVIARRAQQDRRQWTALALLFFYLTLDEAAVIHEMLTTPLRESLHLGGYLYFSWVLVGLPLALIVALLFLPFVRRMPAHTRRSLLAAGLVYLSGAVLVDAIGANLWAANDGVSLLYWAVGTLEEFLEMQGVIIAIYGLLRYLAAAAVTLEIRFVPENR